MEQATNRCRVDAMATGISVVYYLLTVAFAWATSYRASSCIQYGQRAGFRAWEWAMDAEGKRVDARNI
jgi:hypothetical protein